MAATVSETRDRVASLLTEFVGPVELDPAGGLSFAYESTRVFLHVAPHGDTTVVHVQALTNVDITPSAELYKHVALNADSWVYGHLAMGEEGGKANVGFRHSILGDFLDAQELFTAVAAVAQTANAIDDEIKATFGGRLASEV